MTMPNWTSWLPGLLAGAGGVIAVAAAALWLAAPQMQHTLPAPVYPAILAIGSGIALVGWIWRWQVEQETDEAFAAQVEHQVRSLAELAEELDTGPRDCFGVLSLSLTQAAFDRYMSARHPGRSGANEVQVHGVLLCRSPRHPDLTVVQTAAVDTHDLMPTGT